MFRTIQFWCKWTLLFVPVSLSASVLAQNSLQPFSFCELVTGRDFSMTSPGFKDCEKSADEVTCTTLFDEVAGVPAITSYTVYNRQLSTFWISTERDNLLPIVKAFREKYGPACRTTTKKVQNRAGASFDSTEMTWCFATGELQVSEIGARITHSSAIYTDTKNRRPGAKPQVDF